MKISEKGQGLGEFIVLLLLVIIVVLGINIVMDNIENQVFDNKFATGEITLVGQALSFGEIGHPLESAVISEIPYGEITNAPRLRHVTGCESMYLGSKFKTVFVAAPAIVNQITVQVPIQGEGYVNICVANVLTDVPVYIWAE